MENNPPNDFGKVPQATAAFGKIPQDAAGFGNVRNDSAGFRNVPKIAERKENHTLTVREVSRLFEAAGVGRSERSIVNWSQPNALGAAKLDAYFDPNERRYFITPESVNVAIVEEQAKAAKTNAPSEPVGNIPKVAESRENAPSLVSEVDSEDIKRLERDIRDLQITNRAKDMFIDRLEKERDRFDGERREYVAELMSYTRKVGELETKLLRLLPPESGTGPNTKTS